MATFHALRCLRQRSARILRFPVPFSFVTDSLLRKTFDDVANCIMGLLSGLRIVDLDYAQDVAF